MATKQPALPSTRDIKFLQNRVRAAVNYFPIGEKNHRQGVAPEGLREALRGTLGPKGDQHITLRRVAGTSDDEPEYALRHGGQLLFRLVYIPWPSDRFDAGGRWHVRRHPQATWWRSEKKTRRRTGGR